MKHRICSSYILFIIATFFSSLYATHPLQKLFDEGNQHLDQKNYPAAITCYKNILSQNNRVHTARKNLAFAFTKSCAWDKATKQYKLLAQTEPENTRILFSLAHALKEGQRHEEAATYFKKILELDPDHQLAHFNLGLCLLTLERFHKAWPEFEWNYPSKDSFAIHRWQGTDLEGKTILVRAHWGYGDMIQFSRYILPLKKQGATVVLHVYPPLKKLFEKCFPFADEIIITGERFPKHDIQVPLMSLMYLLDAQPDTIPPAPYFSVDDELITFWQNKLTQIERGQRTFRIGICWSGRGSDDIPPGLRKNIPLEKLAPLAELANVKLYSLQKLKDVEQLDTVSFAIHDFGPDFDADHGRFVDTAAVMKNLDLVLTVDTSIAHLAGALGVPVWIMLPWTADWRWFTNRDDSPWYATARLFRQPEPADWASVVHNVQQALEKKLGTANPKQQAQFYVTHGRELQKQKQYREAVQQFKQASDLDPDDHSLWFLIANTYNQAGEPRKAIPWYQKYIHLHPNDKFALHNTALALRRAGRHAEAVPLYKTALARDPAYESAHFGLGQTYLMLGDFERGFPEFVLGLGNKKKQATSELTSIKNVYGKTIVLLPAWGLGDTLQLIRYARTLKERGATVWVVPQKPLIDLLRLCPYIDQIVTDRTIRNFDKKISLLRLPALFKTTVDTVPDTVPYLFANKSLVRLWKQQLQHDKNFKIGLCWEGSTTNLYPRKDVPLERFKTIAQLPGVSLYSLQKMNGTQQLGAASFSVHQFGHDFDTTNGRFMDTAAVMKNLDLVITVDTSIAHLAGGLGVPVWVLLPYAPDWRWMTERNDSPWYPTMKLFRQAELDDWKEALENLTQAVRKKVAHHQVCTE